MVNAKQWKYENSYIRSNEIRYWGKGTIQPKKIRNTKTKRRNTRERVPKRAENRERKKMQLQKQSHDIVRYSLGKSARECKLTLKEQTKVMLWKHSFATGNMF